MGETVTRFVVFGGRATHAVAGRRVTSWRSRSDLLIAACGQSEGEDVASRRTPAPTVTCKACLAKLARAATRTEGDQP